MSGNDQTTNTLSETSLNVDNVRSEVVSQYKKVDSGSRKCVF